MGILRLWHINILSRREQLQLPECQIVHRYVIRRVLNKMAELLSVLAVKTVKQLQMESNNIITTLPLRHTMLVPPSESITTVRSMLSDYHLSRGHTLFAIQ